MTQKNQDINSAYNEMDYKPASFEEIMQASAANQKAFRTTPDGLFGYMLFLVRTELKLSQEEMGFRLGWLSKSNYNKYENGTQSFNISHIFLLSAATNVDRQFFYQLHENLVYWTLKKKGMIHIPFLGKSVELEDFKHTFTNEDIKKTKEIFESRNTPLKEYSLFFGAEIVGKLTAVVSEALRRGELEREKP